MVGAIAIIIHYRFSREGGNLSNQQYWKQSLKALRMQKSLIQPCVYILASGLNGTLYIGVTARLFDRVMVHKQGSIEGFTKEHRISQLVYYEMHETLVAAHIREKQLKKWNRLWKIRLIEEMNPEWRDLHDETEGILYLGHGGQDNALR